MSYQYFYYHWIYKNKKSGLESWNIAHFRASSMYDGKNKGPGRWYDWTRSSSWLRHSRSKSTSYDCKSLNFPKHPNVQVEIHGYIEPKLPCYYYILHINMSLHVNGGKDIDFSILTRNKVFKSKTVFSQIIKVALPFCSNEKNIWNKQKKLTNKTQIPYTVLHK